MTTRKIFILIALILFLSVPPLMADWKMNPHTGKFDYYEADTTTTGVSVYTVATLPAAPSDGDQAIVTDGADDGDCTVGSGTTLNMCVYDDGGAAWVIVGDGAGSGNAFSTHDAPAGTDPVASGADTLTWDDTAPITITGNSATDTITIAITDASTSLNLILTISLRLPG
jgi:hypothetical protein